MYGGYFSSSEITDIDDKYIGSVIDLETLTKMTRQMKISMGGMMWLVSFFPVLIFAVLVYLLSKINIKNSIFRNSLIFQGLPPIKYQNLMYFPLFLPL